MSAPLCWWWTVSFKQYKWVDGNMILGDVEDCGTLAQTPMEATRRVTDAIFEMTGRCPVFQKDPLRGRQMVGVYEYVPYIKSEEETVSRKIEV